MPLQNPIGSPLNLLTAADARVSILGAITETTTARALSTTDAGATIFCTNASGNCTITIPLNATQAISIGSCITIFNQQGSTRLTSVSVTGGVTLIGNVPSVGNNGYFILKKIATNTWQVLIEFERATIACQFLWNGIFSSAQTVQMNKLNSQITIECPGFTLTAGGAGTDVVLGLTPLPSRFRATASLAQGGFAFQDGTRVAASVSTDSGGTLIWNSVDGGGLTATQLQVTPMLLNYLV